MADGTPTASRSVSASGIDLNDEDEAGITVEDSTDAADHSLEINESKNATWRLQAAAAASGSLDVMQGNGVRPSGAMVGSEDADMPRYGAMTAKSESILDPSQLADTPHRPEDPGSDTGEDQPLKKRSSTITLGTLHTSVDVNTRKLLQHTPHVRGLRAAWRSARTPRGSVVPARSIDAEQKEKDVRGMTDMTEFAESISSADGVDKDDSEAALCTVRIAGESVKNTRIGVSPDDLRDIIGDLHSRPHVNAWLDLEDISKQHLNVVSELFRLHPLTAEDCLHFENQNAMAGRSVLVLEREKLEVFETQGYTYIQFHILNDDENIEDIEPIKMLVFNHVLVTVHHAPVQLITDLHGLIQGRVSNLAGLVYELLKAITHQYFEVVERRIAEVDTLEQLIEVLSESEQNDILKRMGVARRSLVNLNHILQPKRRVVLNMMRYEGTNIFHQRIHYLHDLTDHLSVMLSRVQIAYELLDSLQVTYLAKSSLNVATASHQLNNTMGKLTWVATMLLPLTFITSLWGMNVEVPGQYRGDEDGDTSVFWSIATLSVAAIVFGYMYIEHTRGFQ